MYKVLITSSGIGSRLADLTRDKNKALVKIKRKEVISYIIDSYPENIKLVVTIGYLGDGVKEFIKNKYLHRNIKFVKVDNYDGVGSSLGYSMLNARVYLQCPFIFHCNDTIVNQDIPSPEKYNWNGGALGNDSCIFNTKSYSSFICKGGLMTKMSMKGAAKSDFFHIGLVGIKDYDRFWYYMDLLYKANPNDSTLNDCSAIKLMIKEGCKFKVHVFKNWYDTGNLKSIENASKHL